MRRAVRLGRWRRPPLLPILLVSTSALAVASCAPPGSDPSPDHRSGIARAEAALPRFDRPDAARAQAELERVGSSGLGAREVADLYELAAERVAAMRGHSASQGRLLTGEDRSQARSALGAAAPGESLLGWEELGPGNIGGRTRTLVIDPGQPQVLYTGGVSGGLWKSADAGRSWTQLGDSLANLAVNSLVMQPGDPSVLYAGTGEGYFREEQRGTALPLRGGGIFRTDNAGRRWVRLRSTRGSDFHWVNDLAVSSIDPNRVYAATRTGVWRSPDRGETWQRILGTTVKGGCLDLDLRAAAGSDDLLVACGTFEQATVHRSTTAEASPAGFVAVLSDPGMGRTSLGRSRSLPDVVYALAASNRAGLGGEPQGFHALYRSSDGGATWETRLDRNDAEPLHRLLLTNPLSARLRECGFADANRIITMGWYVNVVAVDPVDPERVWVGGVDLFRSDDGGRTFGPASYWWRRDAPSYLHSDQHALVFHPAYDGAGNRALFVANDGGVWRSDDARAAVRTGSAALCDPWSSGVRFQSLNRRLGITQFYHGLPTPDGRSFVGGTQDNGTLLGSASDGIDGWSRIFGGDGGYVAIDPVDPDVLYVESQFGNLQKSVDGGATFESARAGLEDDGGFLFIPPFVLDPGDRRRLWTGGHRIWRTDDGAARWQAASVGLGGDQVSAIAVDPNRSDRVVVGTRDGFVYRSERATAADGATVWPRSRPRSGFVTWLAFDPSDPAVVYATYAQFGGAHVWRSRDGGETWESVDGSGQAALPDLPVHTLAIDPEAPDRLFVGTDLGVFVSLEGGGAWAVERDGLPNTVTEALAFGRGRQGRRSLYAFTHGRGAWRTLLAEPLRPFECVPTAEVHCLRDARFEVSVEWSGPDGGGAARTTDLTGDTGAFWFLGPDNLELIVKVLDGRAQNGHFWVFYGALSDLGYTITVRDSATGQDKVYANPAGRLASAADTEAFLAADGAAAPARRPASRGAAGAGCGGGPEALCLGGGRFRVTVAWSDALGSGAAGVGTAVPVADDTGAFWFFDEGNLELMVKVLDGRGVNGRFWVYYGALSDVAYRVTVTDLVGGGSRVYENVAGELRSVADVEAF